MWSLVRARGYGRGRRGLVPSCRPRPLVLWCRKRFRRCRKRRCRGCRQSRCSESATDPHSACRDCFPHRWRHDDDHHEGPRPCQTSSSIWADGACGCSSSSLDGMMYVHGSDSTIDSRRTPMTHDLRPRMLSPPPLRCAPRPRPYCLRGCARGQSAASSADPCLTPVTSQRCSTCSTEHPLRTPPSGLLAARASDTNAGKSESKSSEKGEGDEEGEGVCLLPLVPFCCCRCCRRQPCCCFHGRCAGVQPCPGCGGPCGGPCRGAFGLCSRHAGRPCSQDGLRCICDTYPLPLWPLPLCAPFCLPQDSESLYASLGRHLLAAAHEGKTCYVQRLLEAGADPNFCAAGKWTPLHRASARGHAAVVCLLLRCGACPNATTACGFTPLHMAACSDACGACVRQLLGAGAIADMWARTGQSPLHVAAARGNVPAVRALVAAGASRCARDDAGRMPCDMAQSCVLRRMLLPPCLAAACRAAPSCSSDSCHTRSCTCE